MRGRYTFDHIYLQNHKTPVHLAAHSGHVEVLRVLIKGYHAGKMVKAKVNKNQVYVLVYSVQGGPIYMYVQRN